ncbi:protocatechuate 3,4-dioxygenase subunit alpha [Roseococcus sp. SYP-B2431]|uniref:protocatechuate 3,4-dioxygenase subunit alpha n=1 Tax=Roseococcus sp. SYP-B2431 TaxID=2496640 RepID=UPI00103A5458|nr:protocatechuate 3,4-dioxygenase subunit alpha [Roseococcus sp. SYP-B2431]TCH95958.1 protocatechuate 3,4-dioxygenase subunit alpha [Roseococcus sp. SYP-B2431]
MSTAHQTSGPFWHLIDFPEWADLLRADGPNAGAPQTYAGGERITLQGTVTDGDGALVTDAMIEIWHADPDGRYDGAFQGFGRCATDAEGRFRFTTLKPGPVPGRGNTLQAPHVQIAIFARGLLRHLTTRLYFAEEPLNESDPLLSLVPPERRCTLIATPTVPGTWQLDIRLQGGAETVFLEL